MTEPTLRDEAALQWGFLEDETDPCLVVSERMEFIYVNREGRALVPDEWFGKRCFEVLPVADEACAFHCPKLDAVSDTDGPPTADVVYCEEAIYDAHLERVVLGVGLIVLPQDHAERARAVFVLRRRDPDTPAGDFESRLMSDAGAMRHRILAQVGATPGSKAERL